MDMKNFLKRFVAALGVAANNELDRDNIRNVGDVDVTAVDFSTVDPTTIDPTTVDSAVGRNLGYRDLDDA